MNSENVTADLSPEAVMAGLSRLMPEEVARLDAMITPETVHLLIKAFGPAMGRILWPLIQNDPTL